MTPIYEKPTWQLMHEALGELPESFSTHEMLNWFAQRYGRISHMTVRMHLRAMSANVSPGWNARWPGAGATLYKLGRTEWTRYDPAKHGQFENGRLVGADDADGAEATDELADAPDEQSAEFALEMHLEAFMEANWARLDFGAPLELTWDESGVSGRQYDTDVGTIDFLCRDARAGNFWVIELKKGRSSDRVVGQIARYMGWVQEHLANGQPVHGLIVTHEHDERLRYAVKMLRNVEAWTYRVNFEFAKEAV